MSKLINFTTLCMVAILLFSILTYAAARPSATFYHVKAGPVPSEDEEVAKAKVNNIDVEDKCMGGGEEECLIRRTLAAHLDYIYTQDNQP